MLKDPCEEYESEEVERAYGIDTKMFSDLFK
jgi:hypothetical protein